jgi:hypothetical protein
MTSSLHSLSPILKLFYQLPVLETLLILCCNCQLRNSILILATWDPRYVASGGPHRKHRFLSCCMLIHCCRDVFNAPLLSNVRGADHKKNNAVLLLLAFTSAGKCLLNRCLAMNYSGSLALYHISLIMIEKHCPNAMHIYLVFNDRGLNFNHSICSLYCLVISNHFISITYCGHCNWQQEGLECHARRA